MNALFPEYLFSFCSAEGRGSILNQNPSERMMLKTTENNVFLVPAPDPGLGMDPTWNLDPGIQIRTCLRILGGQYIV